MLNNKHVQYTAKVRLKNYNKDVETKVIRVDNYNDVDLIREVHVENGITITQKYITGPAADRLYEYEQLGYSPEELKKFIEEHKKYEAIKGKHLYVVPGRGNGKSLRSAQILLEHCLEQDIDPISSLYPSMMIVPQGYHLYKHTGRYPWGTSIPQIKNVMFNDPATIVFWEDGTKTVVKTQDGDKYDPEKGLAMAISKKALGNKRDYYHVFKKWLKKYVPNSRLIFKATSEKEKKTNEKMV